MGTLADFSGFLESLTAAPESDERGRRLALGHALLRLFDADFFASCRVGADGSFAAPVWINMSAENMGNYLGHYQFHDPLTPRMRAAGRAMRVFDAVDPARLHESEFHRDFLAVDGLAEGMNYFPAQSLPGTLDLRIWRAAGRTPFSGEQVRLLQGSGDLLQRLLPGGGRLPGEGGRSRLDSLTARERDVALAVARGVSDRAACAELGCSLGTLRTHLSRVFAKLGVGSRSELAARWGPLQEAPRSSSRQN
ncbi:helix-turn-helix transcriptional regulator [Paeniglutamicibacter sp. R2-26]|uniref:helix-turn-helix transcriptional regulator n=1 Tax=Paeniglutamicibacter sp. R2-26 TaxID=3144417 RepID=UPI003EE6E05A